MSTLLVEPAAAPERRTGRSRYTWLWVALLAVVAVSAVRVITGAHQIDSPGSLRAALIATCPILMAAMGGLWAERAGVVNIGLEGQMILGTWGAAYFTYFYGPWVGIIGAALLGAIGGALHALATVTFGVDHIVSGVAINIIGLGASKFLAEAYFADLDGGGVKQLTGLDRPPSFTVPGLSDAANSLSDKNWFFVSDVASMVAALTTGLNAFTVLVFALVGVTAWALWRTTFGLRLRSCGENPQAAESLGVNVIRYKWIAVLISGGFAGIGGGFLALVASSGFVTGQTGGRGYIGLAAMIFGNWRPGGILTGSLMFGYTDSLPLQVLRDHPRPVAARRHRSRGPVGVALLQGPAHPGHRLRRSRCALPALVPHHRRGAARVHRHDPLHRHPAGPGLRLPAAPNAQGRRPDLSEGQRGLAMPIFGEADWEDLRQRAVAIMQRAYAPYSHYPVGAAARVDDGRFVVGCNVENAAYGVGLCAECGMVSSLHATGGGRLTHTVCVNGSGEVIMPCGRCRQVLYENGGAELLLMTVSGVKRMDEVLPDAFGPDDLA